jgi:hypothetical protein
MLVKSAQTEKLDSAINMDKKDLHVLSNTKDASTSTYA